MKTAKEEQLQKKLSPMNVWALAFGCIIGASAFVLPGTTFLFKGGVLGMIIGIAIAALIMIVIAFNYNYMINEYPIAGGEFTYTQKAFGPNSAYWCSWFLGLSYVCIVPINATALAVIGRNLLGSVFQFGFHYVVAGYDVYLGEVLLAIIALLLFAYLSVRGVKFAGVFQTFLAFSLVGSVLIVASVALLKGSFNIHHLQPVFYPGVSGVSSILAILAISSYAFVGFDTIPQAAEEFKFSPSKSKKIMVLSILLGGFIYVILNTITAAIIPSNYHDWVEYINASKKLSGLESLPTFHAAYQLMGGFGLLCFGVSAVAAALSGIIGFYMASSRLLFSMSREKVIPSWFGELHSKYKTPHNAILFVMLFSLIAPFFGRIALSWIVDMSSVGAAIGYGFTSAAAFLYARRRGHKFIMVTGIIGAIMALIFLVLLLVPIKLFNCSLGVESYSCLIVWIILGISFYSKTQKYSGK